MKKLIIFIISFFIINSCKKEFEIPFQYEGYAILQTKDLIDDGVDLYTFTLLPKLNKVNINEKINFDRQLSNKSVSFLLPPHEEFLLYKLELNKKKWNNDEDLILVKVDYEMLNPKWMEYVKIKSKKISVENKDYKIEDYDFYNLVNNKGESLYKIKNIEYIKKIN